MTNLGTTLPSFWLGRRRPAEEVDVAVVGAGIVGLSTAWWLAKAGRRPVVLDADHVAAHASGRNAGFLMTGTAVPFTRLEASLGSDRALALWTLSSENRELLRGELLDAGRIDCELVPEGGWIAALAGTGQEEELAASVERLRGLGFAVEWRDAAAVRRAAGSEQLGGALFQPRDAGLDPVRLCRGLAAASGAPVRAGARVMALEPEGERVRLVATAADLVAERVVVAANAYAPRLLPHLAAEIRPVRGQVLATGPGPRTLSGVWYVDEGYEYLRQLPDGSLILGGCRKMAVDVEVGYGETPTALVQAALDRFLEETFPALAGRPVVRRWAGIMAFTPDGLPRTGEVPGVPGAIYAAGFNGHGMSLGFATGRWLARRVMGDGQGPLL